MTGGTKHSAESSGSVVTINPVLLFIIIFVSPYFLFMLTMMAVTGRTDIMLIYEAVAAHSDTVYFKAWIIGSFALAILGTLFFSGRRTKQYIVEQIETKQVREKLQGGSVDKKEHFIIENTHGPEALLSEKPNEPETVQIETVDDESKTAAAAVEKEKTEQKVPEAEKAPEAPSEPSAETPTEPKTEEKGK